MADLALSASLILAGWLRDGGIAAALIVMALWLPLLAAFPRRRTFNVGEGSNSHE